MSFKVIKSLNHNVVQVLNENKQDCIIFGHGIGFNAKPKMLIENQFVEKVYFIQDNKNLPLYEKLVLVSDERLVTLIEDSIEDIYKNTGVEPNENLRIALLDHLNFSIYRNEHNINISNMFMDEMNLMYSQETIFAERLLRNINKELNISLPDAEIGFLTLHIHAALNKEKASITGLYLQVIARSFEYLEDKYNLKYADKSVEKIRMITHLKFALKRTQEKMFSKTDISSSIKRDFPKSYNIAKDLALLIKNEFDFNFEEAEVAYLAMHIQLINKDRD